MDMLDLDGQTAPESTRGLFDPPPDLKYNKRRSATDLPPQNAYSRTASDDEGAGSRVQSVYSVSSSSQGGRHSQPPPLRGSTGLHTVNEEEGGAVGSQPSRSSRVDYRSSDLALQGGDQAEASSARKHRSSLSSGGDYTALQNRRSSGTYHARRSSLLDYGQRMGSAFIEEDEHGETRDDDAADDRYSMSRADALAEAEAKLTGTFSGRPHSSQYGQPHGHRHLQDAMEYHPADEDQRRASRNDNYAMQAPPEEKYNRRLSEPNARVNFRHSDMYGDYHDPSQRRSQTHHKRQSLQYPPNQSGYHDIDTGDQSRWSGRPPSLTLDSNRRRSSSRNNGDWRSSMASSILGSNRSSYAFAPFTPTRYNFSREDNSNNSQRRALFMAHLPYSAVVPNLKCQRLMSGLLRVNKRNRSDAYVFCEEYNADIYICGSRDRNRALEGDNVAVKVVEVDKVIREKIEKEEAKLARNNGVAVVRKPDEEDEKEIMFGGEDDVDRVKPLYCGVIVAILEREQDQVFSGTLGLMRPSNKRQKKHDSSDERNDASSPRIVWFKPTDKRVPLIAIPVEQAPSGFIENSEQFENVLFLGSIKRWPITSLHPFGGLKLELGNVNEIAVQFRAILADNSFLYPPEFSESVMRCLPSLPWSPVNNSTNTRRDLSSIRCLTLDQAGNGDHDNALSIETLPDQTYRVGFHVADLSAFVKPQTALDKEGRARSTGVFMHEHVPLWPVELLSECTDLLPGKERFAFSVLWEMNSLGEIRDVWYGKTLVRSRGVLKMDQAQEIIRSGQVPSQLGLGEQEQVETVHDVQTMHRLAIELKKRRGGNGPSHAPSPDLQFVIEDGVPYKRPVRGKGCVDAEDLFTEFKIFANMGVAQKISSHFPESALLQGQSPPNERKLEELTRYLRDLGYHIQPTSANALQSSLDAIENEDARRVITSLVAKTMQPPKFVCAGLFHIDRYHHYALNVPLYTTFTSPSRRYADLVVHRQLEAALMGDRSFYIDQDVLQKTAQHCNVKGQAASNACEQIQHFFLSKYLAAQPKATHEAIVVGVQRQTFDVIVPGLGLERRIHTINLPLRKSQFVNGLLHLYWMPGVATTDAMAEQPGSARREDELEEDDEDEPLETLSSEAKLVEDVRALSVSEKSRTRPRSMSLRVVQGEDPNVAQKECTVPDECLLVIRPFDYIRVVITADPIRNPPLIRVLAANPFLNSD